MKAIKLFLLSVLIIFSNLLFSQDDMLIPYRKGEKWGFSNKNKEIIIPCIYEQTFLFRGNFANVKGKNGFGLISKKGELLVPAKYDRLNNISPNILIGKIKKDYFLYYIDAQKEVALNCDDLRYYDDCGIIKIRKDNKYGLIDTMGNIITEPKYVRISDFSYEIAIATTQEYKDIYIKCNGKRFITVDIITGFEKFKEGFANVSKNGKYGYIDTSGKSIVYFIYDFATPFEGDYAWVRKSGKYGLINKQGRVVIPIIYDGVKVDHVNKQFFMKKGDKMGIVNNNGKVLIPFDYDEIRSFRSGKAIVVKNNKLGVIDTNLKIIVPIEYDRIFYSTKDKYYHLSKDKLYGLTDTLGNIVIPCKYHYIVDFTKELILVKKDSKYGYIDKKDNIIIPIEYESASPFRYGTAWVRKDNKWGMINKTGEQITEYKYETIFEYKVNGRIHTANNIEDKGLTMTRVYYNKHFVRKYKNSMCSSKKYLLRWHFVKKLSKWNGYVSRTGIEYFED